MPAAHRARRCARRSITPVRIVRLAMSTVLLLGCRDAGQPTEPRALSHGLRPSLATVAAAANGKIAFSSTADGGAIFLMNPDGSALTKLTATFGLLPDWSPDGTKIAFACNGEICVIGADGSVLAQITTNAVATHPSWSPDGTKIAFESARDGNNEIYVMNADGSGQENLTDDPGNDKEPAWSPAGTKIAFTSEREGPSQIYVMNADGTTPTRLTNTLGLNDVPAWSPDGSRIVWHSTREGGSHLWVMNADGSGPTRLTNTTADLNIFPAWSPDGTKIAFSRLTGGNFDIYVVNADGSAETQLTSGPAADFAPAWQPVSADSDGDGVSDADDLCPATPEGASVDADGCIPQQRTSQLDESVDDLVTAGTLTSAQATGLQDKLAAALASMDAGRTTAACSQLAAFINQVSAFVSSGALSAQAGSELVAAASATRLQLGC